MIFRQADRDDAEDVLEMYEAVKGSEFCVWNDLYPTMFEIDGDLRGGNLFVLEINGENVGAVSIVAENEMDGFGCWKYGNAAEFARVVIKPEYQHRKLSEYMVSFILEEIGNRGYSAVHISAAKNNIPACATYRRLKFTVAGEADMYGNSYYLMEKKF